MPDKPQRSTFERSLDELKASDLAPLPPKKRRSFTDLLSLLSWILIAAALLGVAVWSGAEVVKNLVDYAGASEDYNEMAGEFSPVSKRVFKPARLKESDPMYPIAGYDALLSLIHI